MECRQDYLAAVLPKPMRDPVTLDGMEALIVQDAMQEFVTGCVPLPDSLDISMTCLQQFLMQNSEKIRSYRNLLPSRNRSHYANALNPFSHNKLEVMHMPAELLFIKVSKAAAIRYLVQVTELLVAFP